MNMRSMAILLALGLAGAAGPLAPSATAGIFGSLPECSSHQVIAKVVRRFNKADNRTWRRGIHLDFISGATERAVNPWPTSSINRRYCRASATLSDGRRVPVHYVVEQRVGFAGTGWNVEFCIGEADRWRVYGGDCRVLRR